MPDELMSSIDSMTVNITECDRSKILTHGAIRFVIHVERDVIAVGERLGTVAGTRIVKGGRIEKPVVVDEYVFAIV